MKYKIRFLLGDILGVLIAIAIFVVPFIFMLTNALKERREANLLGLSWPTDPQWQNFVEVFQTNNYQIVRGFRNSAILVVGGVFCLILVGSMAGYVIQRRKDKLMSNIGFLIMIGLMIPPTIMPTIWVLELLGIYRTLFGMIMVQTALQIPFTVMLYRGYMGSVPVELEEAGYIDGCSRWRIFFSIVMPLLKPVTATVIILNAITIFNDFMNPLYFLPGVQNVTIQVTMFNFMGQLGNEFHLLFANAILITVPMLILFLFFNKRIVSGMAAGAVKG